MLMQKTQQTIRKKIKRSFTLLEIFLVLTIVSVVGTVVGIRISYSLKKYRFEHSARRLKSHLKLYKDLAVNIQSDLLCTLEQTSKGLFSTVISTEGAEVFRGQTQLTESFEHIYLPKEEQSLFIEFFSSGADTIDTPFYVVSKSENEQALVYQPNVHF